MRPDSSRVILELSEGTVRLFEGLIDIQVEGWRAAAKDPTVSTAARSDALKRARRFASLRDLLRASWSTLPDDVVRVERERDEDEDEEKSGGVG